MIARLKRRTKWRLNLFDGYSSTEKPLKEYAVLVTVLNGGILLTLAGGKRGRRTAARMGGAELVIYGLAAHKLARLISKDKVTSPLRAPFTRFVESAGAGEVEEVERGTGMRRAIGELMSCPYCASPWASAFLVLGHAVNPRISGAYARILALTAVSHFLNQAYAKAKEANQQT